MKRGLAGLITIGLLAGVLLWSVPRGEPPVRAEDDTPEACVQRMFVAAEAGDVATYLDCFTGAERRRLERELADQSRDAFARALQQAVQQLKGRAVFAPSEADVDADTLRLTVERVYVNRTERQTYQMVRRADGWRIASVQTAQAYQPLKPYGTPVFELPQSDVNGEPSLSEEEP
jgi:hypothetical protein